MEHQNRFLVGMAAALLLTGCAGGSTDPRTGGLLSYNPDAYEQRLQERQAKLAAIRQGNESLQAESSQLEAEKSARLEEKASVEKELKKVKSSVAALEKNIKAKQTRTTGQQEEQQRLLKEVESIKTATKATDNVADPEEQRLELERLKSRRDKLEKEAANLMKL